MTLFKADVFARLLAVASGFYLLGIEVAKGDVPPLEPGEAVESRSISDDSRPALDNYLISVHVILQHHLTPVIARQITQDQAAVAECQDQVYSTALELAKRGTNTVVIEGFYASGSLKNPQRLSGAPRPEAHRLDAKWALLGKGLAIYGFGVRYLNEYSIAISNELGASSSSAQSIAKSPGFASSAAKIAAAEKLTQEEVARVNVFLAGIVPTISFLGLQTALAVALAREERSVQLIIGKSHWDDLVYAINLHKDIRIRLIPYRCK